VEQERVESMQVRLRALRPFTLAIIVALTLSGGVFLRHNAAPAAAKPAAAVVEVAIRNFSYSPTPLVIAPGTTVRWTNFDFVSHDVTGEGSWGSVRSPLLGQGQSWEYTFDTPGTYTYFCTPHKTTPSMHAQVQVGGGSEESVNFPETGFTVKGRFLTYWRAHGLEFGDAGISYRESLGLFGFPISDEKTEKLEDGKEYSVQYFERARFEYHPENADPANQVLLGQFGRILHPADPPVAQKPGATFFNETGHNLEGKFATYWNLNGGLPIFGFPLSEQIQEKLSDGNTYTVQYFERARLELHPEANPPYDVQLGQFGRQILGR
jgi:plastocyanin